MRGGGRSFGSCKVHSTWTHLDTSQTPYAQQHAPADRYVYGASGKDSVCKRVSTPERDVNLNSCCRNFVDAAPEERKSLAQVREPWVRLEKPGERRRCDTGCA